MLVNAMEASGIEGTYRFTCQRVMRVLRSNKDSLMAMLEAFVYDPLISWGLLIEKKYLEHINRADADVSDSNLALNLDPADLMRASVSSDEEVQLLGDESIANPLSIDASIINDNKRRHSKAVTAFSDSERVSSIDGIPAAHDTLNVRY
jgi:phosphatidylinositol kinase/protein kinase (PI-3  family)